MTFLHIWISLEFNAAFALVGNMGGMYLSCLSFFSVYFCHMIDEGAIMSMHAIFMIDEIIM